MQALHLEICSHDVEIALDQEPGDLHLDFLLLCDACRHPQRLHVAPFSFVCDCAAAGLHAMAVEGSAC